MSISRDELKALLQTYNESKKADNQFEIVWIPVEKQWTEKAQQNFQSLQSEMPWLTVQFSSLGYETPAGRAAIKFIKQEWSYENNSIAVSLDAQGRVQHPNAFYMIRIWGHKAYPFSNSKEKALWQEQCWSTELLLQEIYPKFQTWVIIILNSLQNLNFRNIVVTFDDKYGTFHFNYRSKKESIFSCMEEQTSSGFKTWRKKPNLLQMRHVYLLKCLTLGKTAAKARETLKEHNLSGLTLRAYGSLKYKDTATTNKTT